MYKKFNLPIRRPRPRLRHLVTPPTKAALSRSSVGGGATTDDVTRRREEREGERGRRGIAQTTSDDSSSPSAALPPLRATYESSYTVRGPSNKRPDTAGVAEGQRQLCRLEVGWGLCGRWAGEARRGWMDGVPSPHRGSFVGLKHELHADGVRGKAAWQCDGDEITRRSHGWRTDRDRDCERVRATKRWARFPLQCVVSSSRNVGGMWMWEISN